MKNRRSKSPKPFSVSMNRRSKKRKLGFHSPLSSGLRRGSTLMSAKHNEGMLMSVDSLVFGTSKEVRNYEEPSKIQKIGTRNFNYMLYGGCGVSLTIDVVFQGLMKLAERRHKQGTVLTAIRGIKFAKKTLGWSYKNLRQNVKLEYKKAYTTVMLASYETKGAEADGKEASFKFDGGSDSGEGSDNNNEEDIVDTDDEESEDEDEEEEENEDDEEGSDNNNEEDIEDTDDEENEDENKEEEENEDDEEGRDKNIKDSEEEEREEDEDEGESGNQEGRYEVPKAELQLETKEEQKVGIKNLFLSTIRSVDKYKDFRKIYAHLVVEDELKDDVPVPPAVEFNPAEFFSSGDFQANSMAGLYGADHETCYSIPKLSVKGEGREDGLKHLNVHFKKDSNLDDEAVTVFQDAMVDACAAGKSGGTIRVYSIDKQNNIRDLACDTLSELQQAKAGRVPKGLKRPREDHL